MTRWLGVLWLLACVAHLPAQMIHGLDISMLPEIEKAGGRFRGANGKPAEAITVMRDHGWQLFRVRLFVNPEPEFWKTEGATQDLAYVRQLCGRIKAAGGQILLDFHYSDTWADPKHQKKPKAWRKLDFEGLVQQVGAYTESVMKDLQAAGVGPDMVQIGNEITPGILWPDGKVDGTPKQWERLATLLDAGCQAVRRTQGEKKIPIMLHVHSGGRRGVPQYFFKNLKRYGGRQLDFDMIGLSFYPTWNDSIDVLRKNIHELVATYDKDVMLVEVAYPYRKVKGIEGHETMNWPMTRLGQRKFLVDLRQLLDEVPNGRGRGYVWWYPESVPVRDRRVRIWRGGAEALFDSVGDPLPALRVN